jgi:hypothetical protein
VRVLLRGVETFAVCMALVALYGGALLLFLLAAALV